MNDLQNQILLLLEDGHCMRDHALEICYQAKAKEAENFRAASLETLRHMVASNTGMTLIPKLAQRANDGIHYLSFKSPKPTRCIGLATRSSSAKKILMQALVIEIRKMLSKVKAIKSI